MKILNIHGFDGTPNNTNAQILNEYANEKDGAVQVISVSLDYRNNSLVDVYSCIRSIAKTEHIDLIVATSFGAFVGKHLSLAFSIPLICTNPCFRPDITLNAIAPEYFEGKIGQLNAETVTDWRTEHHGTYSNDHIFLGRDDNVIDSSITLNEANSNLIYLVDGGHSLPRESYEDKLIYILDTLRKENP